MSPASLSQRYQAHRPSSNPEGCVSLFGAGKQEVTEAGKHSEAGLHEAEVVGLIGPKAWACLPGQGLRYLEHLCLVLEQMVRLQQLYLELQTQRLPGDLEEDSEPPALASHAPGSEVHQRSWELLSQTQQTVSFLKGQKQLHAQR
ncbi:uncharacterized protein C8orf58 homolog [Erinaceus europaeus]|uniref:Uncharacterized protein C8orf58 homolog n=1 Tax=Erinaceus europaeus TaxID=9365 RepID=A0ABM3WE47_ERIEU|nr:uncharacterized protein C8orf58 homolog [Erinaceus europaeus]